MTALQTVCLLAVAVAGTADRADARPAAPGVVVGLFGLALPVLFLAFGAPDVALSQIVVAGGRGAGDGAARAGEDPHGRPRRGREDGGA